MCLQALLIITASSLVQLLRTVEKKERGHIQAFLVIIKRLQIWTIWGPGCVLIQWTEALGSALAVFVIVLLMFDCDP